MFKQEIICTDEIKLIKPDIERDVPLGMEWTKGEIGRQTLSLMGNVLDENFKPDRHEEIKRYEDFLYKTDELNWMIEYQGRVIGTVWADLAEKYGVKPPSVHIMIGDVSSRGKGVGTIAEASVINYLIGQGHKTIYSRALVENDRMLHIATKKLGYKKDGEPYTDENGLVWQNLIIS